MICHKRSLGILVASFQGGNAFDAIRPEPEIMDNNPPRKKDVATRTGAPIL